MTSVLERSADPATLSHEQRLELLDSIRADRAVLEAVEQQTLAVMSRDDVSGKQWVRDEIGHPGHLPRHRRRTPSAPGTTTSNTKPAGPSDETPTAPPSGDHPPAATTNSHPTTPSLTPTTGAVSSRGL